MEAVSDDNHKGDECSNSKAIKAMQPPAHHHTIHHHLLVAQQSTISSILVGRLQFSNQR